MANTPLIGTKNKKGQVYTDPNHLFFEAPRDSHFLTGSEIIKEAIKRSSCEMSIAYPITPQSEAAALIGELFAEGYVDIYSRGANEFDVMSIRYSAARRRYRLVRKEEEDYGKHTTHRDQEQKGAGVYRSKPSFFRSPKGLSLLDGK